MDHLCYLCLCHAFASVYCCRVVTCWESSDLMTLVCDVKLCFVTFPCGILGQAWYLIVSLHDLCRHSYFDIFYLPNMLETSHG